MSIKEVVKNTIDVPNTKIKKQRKKKKDNIDDKYTLDKRHNKMKKEKMILKVAGGGV